MGFLQRFLSLGSRKNKKRRAALTSASTAALESGRTSECEQEIAASKLLRSSSTHFKVVSEVDYAKLPPIPHPVNNLSSTPLSSPSRSTLHSRGRTYSVKILGERQVLATTEFPNANPPIHTPTRCHEHDDDSDSISSKHTKQAAITPHDQSRIHGLRQDPSVASLLDMYDDHGNLDSKVFTSSPAKQGRTQMQRSGSTLRQLLGRSEPHGTGIRNSTTEGDISWAERFLRERDGSDHASSTSESGSPPLDTPKDTVFASDPIIRLPGIGDPMISTKHDASLDYSAGVNSLEVEISATSEEKCDCQTTQQLTTHHREPVTSSRPASEVFGFILERRKSNKKPTMAHMIPSEAPNGNGRPPALPTPSTDYSMDGIPNTEAIPPPHPSPTHSHANTSHSTEASSSTGSIFEDPPSRAMIVNRTPVLLSSNTARAQQLPVTTIVPTSRIPRGPRRSQTSALLKTHNTGSSVQSSIGTAQSCSMQTAAPLTTTPVASKPSLIPVGQRDALRSTTGARTNVKTASTVALAKGADGYMATPSRRPHKRISSSPSAKSTVIGSMSPLRSAKRTPRPRMAHAPSSKESTQDENAFFPLDVKSRLPITPARQRSIFSPPHSQTPSPASSSELSPVGQMMMAELRSARKVGADGHEHRKNRFAEFVLLE